jgi:integrase/recombinase XerD
VPEEILDPVSEHTVKALLASCNTGEWWGMRDYAVILTLLDTGLRASEFLALNVGDVDLTSGTVRVHHAKGRRARFAFLGESVREAIQNYLGRREVHVSSALWVTREDKRLSYTGLRDILRRRAKRVGVEAPTLHSFRRAFAILCLRRGVDIYSLQRLMGHSDLSVLRRYLAQTQEDLREAHQLASPADGLVE